MKLFCSLQAVALGCGGEKLSLVPLVGLVMEIVIQVKLHCDDSEAHILGQRSDFLTRVLHLLLQCIDDIQ